MSHEIAEAAANMQEATRLRAENAALRADLDTLRNGVAWLGAERDRAWRWAALWKRAAKRGAREWRDLAAAYEDMRAENTTVRRVARLLVAAWRQERQATQYWAGVVDLYRVALERAASSADEAQRALTDEWLNAIAVLMEDTVEMLEKNVQMTLHAETGHPYFWGKLSVLRHFREMATCDMRRFGGLVSDENSPTHPSI